RSRTPDGADHHATFCAFIHELLEGLDRRILFQAKLPAHHAPSIDRDEGARLVAGPPDHLADPGAGRGLRHHHVTVRPGGMQFAARHASARPQDIVEARLHSLLLEIGLDDARGRVDRATGRLIDDPADVTGGKRLLRPRGGRPLAKPRRSGDAECGAPPRCVRNRADRSAFCCSYRSPSASQRPLGSHMPSPLSSARRYKKCASATSCDTRPVVWIRIRSSSRSRPFFAPDTNSWISPCSCSRENWPDSIIRLNSPCSMLKSQLSM